MNFPSYLEQQATSNPSSVHVCGGLEFHPGFSVHEEHRQPLETPRQLGQRTRARRAFLVCYQS